MPTVLAQSNLPKSAAVVVSSETIILRDPNNSILEKYTSDEQKQLSLKSYGIKPETLLSPGENKTKPAGDPLKFFEWIKEDGDAYIATGFIPNAKTKIQVDFKYIDGNSNYFFGVRSPSAETPSISTRFTATVTIATGNRLLVRVYWGLAASNSTAAFADSIDRAILRIGGGFVQLNDNEPIAITDYDPNIAASQQLFIFAENSSSTDKGRGNAYIFSYKIYDEADNLLMSFKPATLNGEPGLYDEISSTFFGNASESGTFIVGDGETPSANLLGGSLGSPSSISDE